MSSNASKSVINHLPSPPQPFLGYEQPRQVSKFCILCQPTIRWDFHFEHPSEAKKCSPLVQNDGFRVWSASHMMSFFYTFLVTWLSKCIQWSVKFSWIHDFKNARKHKQNTCILNNSIRVTKHFCWNTRQFSMFYESIMNSPLQTCKKTIGIHMFFK